MQNQYYDENIQKRRFIQLRRGKWRHIALIIALLATVSILSPLILLRAMRGEAPYQTDRPGLNNGSLQHAKAVKQNQSEQTMHSAKTAARIDGLLDSLVKNQQFSGSVLVAKQGQTVLSKGYSQANWDNSTANTPETRFYLASVTKQFTAMAILMLQEQGKLRVGDRLCTYITSCPTEWAALTIHQLLTHTSGIPELDTSLLSGDSPEAWINSFSSTPLQFIPGDQFQYCSTCYQILAYVVQKTSGMPYSQFIQKRIFDPLQMKASGFDSNFYYSQSAAASGYQTWQVSSLQLGWEVDPQWSFLFGSGLMYSTVKDLYLWDRALYSNKLISSNTLTEAFTPYVNASLFPGSSYGYGWFITQSPVKNHRLIWHNGVVDGFRNYIGRYVDDDTTIIILSNLTTLDTIALAHSIEQVVFR